MNPEAAKRLRLLASALSLILLLVVLAFGWFYWRIRASLPDLDGVVTGTSVTANVTIERDGQGVPTIRGATRIDVARALGYAHGQDRFFQMDLMRRNAAGELSELFGTRAMPRDRANRIHDFRGVAQKALARLDPTQRGIIEAYAAGVNAGLGSLGAAPFEYLILREKPQPWKPEDGFLVSCAMALDMQDENGSYERSLMAMRSELGRDAAAFFAPVSTPEDAALDGTTTPLPPMPGPAVLNLRNRKSAAHHPRERRSGASMTGLDSFLFAPRDPETAIGSNSFALAGSHTASGAALLANDMHLNHGVPNTWYRAVLIWGDNRVAGVTIPGAPVVVAGSNGHLAWGFTNAYIDTLDLVDVSVNSISRQLYTAPGHEGLIQIEKRKETIRTKGHDPAVFEYSRTVWGPLVEADETQRPLAIRWAAHDVEATNLSLIEMETARTVADGIAVAHRTGIPPMNIMLADRAGDIAWTIAGRVPKRVGYDGRTPVAWAYGDRKWDGYLTSAETPVVRGNESTLPGRLWSANQRQVGGEALAKLGDGAYRRSARGAQIRDDLAKLEKAVPKDLLAVQLDDRALFLERWHKLLMDTLTPATLEGKKGRAALRSFAEKWEGRATTEAVSYRLVREFRIAVHTRLFVPLFAPCTEALATFDWRDFQLEQPLWQILQERPQHLLPQPFGSWDELLLAACDDVITLTDQQRVAMPKANWGWHNTVRIRHPFSYSYPWLARWLDMPATPQPGGDDMPRVQSPSHGASERLVVSPGREDEGIFHMPGGQSGHPLSPYYRAGHEAWARGEPTPFLPGKPQHTLTLAP
ncbi:MAG: penicillin acylase family protein [Verrucomicrobiota bacterium]